MKSLKRSCTVPGHRGVSHPDGVEVPILVDLSHTATTSNVLDCILSLVELSDQMQSNDDQYYI